MPEPLHPRLSIRPIDAYYVGRVEDDVLTQLQALAAPGRVAVDAGCGWGEKTEGLRRLGFEAIGVEHDPARVAKARSAFPACAFVEGSVEALPLPDASVDVVFSNSVLQYVDLDTTLAEYARVLRPGGRLILIENLRHNPIAMAARLGYRLGLLRYTRYMTPQGHVTPTAVKRLAHHGFDVADSRTYNLLTPLRLAVQGAADRLRLPALRRLAPRHDTLVRLDDWLLEHVPASKHACWTLYASASRSDSHRPANKPRRTPAQVGQGESASWLLTLNNSGF